MIPFYHKEITTEALSPYFSERALSVIVKSNQRQDSIIGQLFHPEYHFDNNQIAQGNAYIEKQRNLTINLLNNRRVKQAWQSFGQLIHTAQDFYAHTNYIASWLESLKDKVPQAADLTILDPNITENVDFHSHNVYFPLDIVGLIPGMAKRIKHNLPPDSHTIMNLDSPESGEAFTWAYKAAVLRSQHELKELIHTIGSTDLVKLFLDKSQIDFWKV